MDNFVTILCYCIVLLIFHYLCTFDYGISESSTDILYKTKNVYCQRFIDGAVNVIRA